MFSPLMEAPLALGFGALSIAAMLVAFHASQADSIRFTLLAMFVAIGTMVIALSIALDMLT